MRSAGQATILHADLDAFYASVEQLLDAGLRGKPIAVGGGVVLAASYEARAFGVRGGMTGWKARELCPPIRFVPGHFAEYQRLGDDVMDVLRDFTPFVERLSIDEAFLDVAGATHLFGSPARIASSIRRRVSTEIGLPISIGVATTKHLAKVASQVAKPDGLVVVPPGGERDFLKPLPVELVWGVGPVTRARLASVGIHTVGDLAATKSQLLQSLLGAELGAKIAWLATNVDSRRVERSRRAASVGAQATLGRREPTEDLLRTTLCYLSDRVASRMRSGQTAGRTVTVRVRFRDLRSVTRSVTLPVATSSTLTLTEVSTGLAKTALADHPEEDQITLLAVSVSQLVHMPALQLEFPLGVGEDNQRAGSPLGAARWSVDRSVDAIRARFGRDAVDYAAVKFSGAASVPDAFRALAEHRLGSDAPEDSEAQVR